MPRRDNERLRQLRARVRETSALIRQLRCELEALRAEMALERERIELGEAQEEGRHEMYIVAQRDSGRTFAQIAASLGWTEARVKKVMDDWREREGVTIRQRAADKRRPGREVAR